MASLFILFYFIYTVWHGMIPVRKMDGMDLIKATFLEWFVDLTLLSSKMSGFSRKVGLD